jgi:hypothetical protein
MTSRRSQDVLNTKKEIRRSLVKGKDGLKFEPSCNNFFTVYLNHPDEVDFDYHRFLVVLGPARLQDVADKFHHP